MVNTQQKGLRIKKKIFIITLVRKMINHANNKTILENVKNVQLVKSERRIRKNKYVVED